MKLSRRNFLFGSAAALGGIALAPCLGPVAWPDDGYKKRMLYKIGISSPAKSEEIIEFWLKRWPTRELMFYAAVPARSTYAWLPQPGLEPIFTDTSPMLIEATGCPSQITIDGHDDGVLFTERYRFPGPHKERWVMGDNGSGPWLV